jgi:amidase
LDKSGPKLNAIIELNPDARAIAAEADKERKAGKVKSILHGIPVLIKDNINTGDKMQTTAGALALAGNHATNDAFIIARLRKAGAILLGKTNLSEWANFRSTNSSSGWSSRGGQTKNPYILDHNPCGSSSGSGSAVAANLCAVAIGTETDGSITCPASVANIVGIKPTVGLWSRSGIIPISSTQDTAGPMGRTVKDVALFLGLLTGIDEKDPLTKESQIHLGKDYTKHLSLDALKGKSIGIDMKKSSNHNINRLLLSNIQVLEKLGATVVPVEYSTKFEALGKYESEILRTEFKEGVNAYLSSAHLSIKNLKDVIEFNIKNEDLAMPYFKQEILEACEKKTGLNSTDYLQALTKGRDESRKIILDLMQEHQLDGFAGITMGPACSIDVMYGDRWGDDFITQPPAMSGFPHVTVPGGWIHNLPVGFSFFAEPYSEAKILGLAYAFEQTTKHRKKPTYKPSFLD